MLEKVNKAIVEEYFSTELSEPHSSNSDYNLEVIDTSNLTLKISEDGIY